MVNSLPLRDIPATTALYADFWEGAPALRGLLPRHFAQEGAFAEQAKRIDGTRYDRQTLRDVLREQNERFAAGDAALSAIDRLVDPRSVVVIGGQQAGLFGGPLYTVHKALTILQLSRRLEKQMGRPVIPVFWIASEDSDLAEVDHAFVTDADGALRQLKLPSDSPAKMPVSRVRLGEKIGGLIDELAVLLPEGGCREEVLADLRAAYTPGRTYPQAFGAWMAGLFRRQGLVMVDPSDTRLKRIAEGLFLREIQEMSPVSSAVIEQTERLKKAGYAPQIDVRPGFLTLFYQDPAREALSIRDGGFELKSSGKRFAVEELAAALREDPDKFTPNAVLRPLLQDTLFPTLAAVLGPAEIAYWCQLTLAYERMGIPMPIVFPRSSLTIVDPAMARLRERLHVELRDLLKRGAHIVDEILAREIPPSLTARMKEGRTTAQETWAGIAAEIDALDPTLHRTAQLASARTMMQFDFIDRKIAKAARRKNATVSAQAARLVASLAPRGGLQERTLCVLPFLARYGSAILDTAAEAIDPFTGEHREVVVEQ
ncbi:MAG: bacillithiol biosynthesis cysteine-adding enzyme BshC [Spirochaetia bacterium]